VLDGGQLLVDGLQLLLAGFEFFDGRAQLLDDRLQLLIRRPQLLVRSFILLNRDAELALGALRFLLERATISTSDGTRGRSSVRATDESTPSSKITR
jgi:hypothetical protein